MARLHMHGKIIETWEKRLKPSGRPIRYHITDTGQIIRTVGPRNGGAKMVRTKDGVTSAKLRAGDFAKMSEEFQRYLEANNFQKLLARPQF